jgi:hypothetical protein
MGKLNNIELRKQKNAPFCKAFDYIAELKEVSDKILAEMIGSKGPYISMYRNGTKPVPIEIMENLVLQSEGELNMEYLRGNSEYMLLRNVPDDEIANIQMRKSNPDYDVIEKRRKEIEKDIDKNLFPHNEPHTDNSSLMNATISAQTEIPRFHCGKSFFDIVEANIPFKKIYSIQLPIGLNHVNGSLVEAHSP